MQAHRHCQYSHARTCPFPDGQCEAPCQLGTSRYICDHRATAGGTGLGDGSFDGIEARRHHEDRAGRVAVWRDHVDARGITHQLQAPVGRGFRKLQSPMEQTCFEHRSSSKRTSGIVQPFVYCGPYLEGNVDGRR
jgi:hypothetical protein